MTERRIGWAFVAVQAVLLVVLVLAPDADHWPTGGAVRIGSALLVGAGLTVMVVAALGLGSALTPTPVPRSSGQLATQGLYRYCRHPIYSGILIIVAGLVIDSGNLWSVIVGAITVTFFNAKASWEETRLTRHFPGYSAYAATTPRFLPRIRGRTGHRDPKPSP